MNLYEYIKYILARILLKFCSPGLNPKIRLGDKIWTLRMFVRNHKRLPSKDKMIFSDVLYRLKTSDEALNPLRAFTSDKEFLRIYVRGMIGEKYNVPILAILRTANEVENFFFPPKCCIKPTHLSNEVILRKKNEVVDKLKIKKWFSTNYYKSSREANYKNLTPKVIVEPLIFDGNPLDFKFFCFNGKPKMIQVNFDSRSDTAENLYDTSWNELDYSKLPKRRPNALKKPANLKEMLEVAAQLSEPFSFVRIDMYSNGKKILVGEVSHVSGNIAQVFYPRNAELKASKLIFGN
jgi:hypothetical protein